MRVAILLLLVFLCAAPSAAAQYAEPTGVRNVDRGPAVSNVALAPRAAQRESRIKRVVLGAVIGAVVLAPVGWFIQQGACEDNNCGGREGLAVGAAAGVLAGSLVAALFTSSPRPE